MDEALERWTAKGYIEPSRAWVSCNPVFVEKKNGSIRTCIDYRPINAVTKPWDWPLPRIKDLRHHVLRSEWFSRIDLVEAFHRVSIPDDQRPWTAFHTHRGTYQFTRMPFGLSTAPATFQRFLQSVLGPVRHKVIHYVDDILIHDATLTGHDHTLREVERKLRQASIEINETKSERRKRSVTFVGLNISKGKLGASLPVTDWPVPRTKPEWQSALGYANCFRDFVPGFSDLTAGLYPSANELPLGPRQQKWRHLWNAISAHLDLANYDDTKPGMLYLDASQYAVGGVLTQPGKGVCAVFSKALSGSQSRYSATDREHLALLIGLETFKLFLHSNSLLQTNTDHTALLNRQDDKLTNRQMRWKTRIHYITSNIHHVAGKDNPADYWSRQGWKGGGDKVYIKGADPQ